MGFRDRFINFMRGRYGIDEFGRFLNIAAIVLAIIGIFIKYVWIASILVIAYSYFRMFSRNIAKRSAENQKYCAIVFRGKPRSNPYGNSYGYNSYNTGSTAYANMTPEQKKALDKKTHKIFKCPNCGQKVRVPKGKGKISIRCPKCRIEFIKKT